MERLRHRLGLFAALRTVLLLLKPVRKASSAENVQARRQLNRLMQKFVADAAFVLKRQFSDKFLVALSLCVHLFNVICLCLYFCRLWVLDF